MNLYLEHGKNIYSQFGDDGMIEVLMGAAGVTEGFCVEFGAWDGIECSNTKALRDKGWSALLIEGDTERHQMSVDAGHSECLNLMVEPVGEHTIDAILDGREVDFMSIDVDGDDYFIFESMETRPKLVEIEYNCSIPWFFDIRAANLHNYFGASALSLYRLAAAKGYFLVGANPANLFFAPKESMPWLASYVVKYEEAMQIMPWQCGFVISDYGGHPLTLGVASNEGTRLPWGIRPGDFDTQLIIGERYPYGIERIECPTCKRVGWVGKERCTVCGGSGVLWVNG